MQQKSNKLRLSTSLSIQNIYKNKLAQFHNNSSYFYQPLPILQSFTIIYLFTRGEYTAQHAIWCNVTFTLLKKTLALT